MASIYLSPSVQEYNVYYDGSGSEEYYMNLIADAMEPYLTASGITFTRNSPDMTVNQVVAQSNMGNYGLHLALHSNASPESLSGRLTGSDVYYYTFSDVSKRAAIIFSNALKDIYPDPNKVQIRPNSTFAELRRTRSPAILVELAYHDNPSDAEWIKNNIGQIARTLVIATTEFLGIPFVEPEPIRTGVVRTQGGRLNVRQLPSMSGTVIGQIPNGSSVLVLGKTGNWYIVSYNSLEGYSFADYIYVDYNQ